MARAPHNRFLNSKKHRGLVTRGVVQSIVRTETDTTLLTERKPCLKPASGRSLRSNARAWPMKTRRSYSPSFRVYELDRLFVGRYGSILPEDDAGRDDAAVMLDHLAGLDDFHSRSEGFLNVRAPWMSNQERTSMKQRATSSRKRWTASELGEHLQVQPSERSTHRTWSIRPVDASGRAWSALQLRQERASKARERARRARARANGKRILRRRPKIVDRARAVLNALPNHSPRSIAWLITQVEGLAEFCKKDGRPLSPSSMPRLVKRAVEFLKSKMLVAVQKVRGPRGEIIQVSRNVKAVRTQNCPHEDSGGTNIGSHRDEPAGQDQFAPLLEPDKNIVRTDSATPWRQTSAATGGPANDHEIFSS
jgi:hypothetical protein